MTPAMRLSTLCYIEADGAYLMLHRIAKQHDVNQGKWIGVGGKFEAGESPDDCLLREVKEETGLTLTSYRYRGIITFVYNGKEPEYIHLYTADGFTGQLSDHCDEGELAWVKYKEIGDLRLWPGDRLFLSYLLADRPAFSLKLVYQGDELLAAVLDGEHLDLVEAFTRTAIQPADRS